MSTLLVIDDEASVRYSFARVFSDKDVHVITAASAAEGVARLQEDNPDVVVLDIQLPDRSGIEVFHEIQDRDTKRPVIFITAHGTTDTAIEAMKHGAFDYLVKPVDLERLSQVLERAFEAARQMRVPAVLPEEKEPDRIIGHSAIMQEMSKAIGRIAPQDVNVLILGESGTGKELVARALYHHGKRSQKPFLTINCAALPEALLESELFGHEQGAFTGAYRRRIGKFEQCRGGTLFLDEIGDMSAGAQAKMLRVLQEQRFERLGGNETLTTQVRVLAATNQDLEKLVAHGRFRRDLYYRLKVVTISVPPLRDRREDIAELAHYFLFRFDHELGLDLRGFAPEALALLQEYAWPGNVRELQGVIKQAMLEASGHIILPEFLPTNIRSGASISERAQQETTGGTLESLIEQTMKGGEDDLYRKVITAAERALFARVLRATGGHQGQASELLGLDRKTLRNKLRSLGLTIDKAVTSPGNDDSVEQANEEDA
jgi:two-component system nitrogen regulation response regulator GlnG